MLWPESEDKYTTIMLRIQDGLNEPASTFQRTSQEKHGKHGKTSFVHFIERFFSNSIAALALYFQVCDRCAVQVHDVPS